MVDNIYNIKHITGAILPSIQRGPTCLLVFSGPVHVLAYLVGESNRNVKQNKTKTKPKKKINNTEGTERLVSASPKALRNRLTL